MSIFLRALRGPRCAFAYHERSKAETLETFMKTAKPTSGSTANASRVCDIEKGALTHRGNGSPLSQSCGARWSRAQSAVELALALPLFFLLIFTVMDLGRMFFVQ